MFTLKSRNQERMLSKPLIMGIVNCTNDSFYASSRSQQEHELKDMIEKMMDAGVDIIDIGGQSTRPGSIQVTASEEINRVDFAISYVSASHPQTWISIDTTRAAVARFAVEHGAHMVNDISGGEMDRSMISTVASLNVPFVCTHMQGRPETMQDDPAYTDVADEVLSFFTRKIQACHLAGIKDVIVDPGFGFGKRIEHNYALVQQLDRFQALGCPILVGFSRKSMIYNLLNTTPEHALNGTTVLNTIALLKGAMILRVHDVREAAEAINIVEMLKK